MAVNLEQLADKITELQAKIDRIKTAADAKIAPLKQEIEPLEEQLLLAMQDQGVELFKGKKSEAKISEKLRVSFADFEAFEKFVLRRKALHLFERRIGIKAYREMKESMGNKPIPGLSEFQQQSLTVKKA